MARTKDRERAIKLRKKGMSYSMIKNELGISKSTLSGWLKDMPLSRERIKELRHGDAQIERTRQTKLNKKIVRKQFAFKRVSRDIESSKNIKFISGFYLYWGEGTKTAEYTVSLTNSDPSMVRCFVEWLTILQIEKRDMRVKLHVYNDQDELKLKRFWSDALEIPIKNFNKSYVKDSNSDRKTYKGTFPYGTFVVAYHDRDTREYVLAGIEYLREKHSR